MIEKQEIVSGLNQAIINFDPEKFFEHIRDSLYSHYVQNSKFKTHYYPKSVFPKRPTKKFSCTRSRYTRSRTKKSTPEKTENDDGDPHRIRGITFTNYIFNIETSGQFKTRISELETELAACREQLEEARREISGREELPPKAKKSYLTIIAALCNKRQPLDITSSSAVSVLKTEIEKIGLTLGEDTIRKIIKEVRDIVAS